MNKKLKWVLFGLGGLILLLFVVKLIAGNKDEGTKVTTEKVTRKTIIETVNASGKVYPEVEVKISPDISGEVVDLRVKEGDSVKRGQVLARIYADIYELQRDDAASRVNQSQASVANSNAALEALRVNMEQAKQTYDRNKKLFDEKVISRAELENFETTYESAKANYNAAQANIRGLQAGVRSAQTNLSRANKDLTRTTLVAPMNGVISSMTVKEGERVAGNSFNVGTEMMRVADMSVLEVRVDVGENDVVKVSIGDSADIEVDAYSNRKFQGIVTQIASSTKSSNPLQGASTELTNYEVRIRILPSSYADLVDPTKPRKWPFRPGMNASADIKTSRHVDVLAIPINAVTTREKGSDKTMEERKKEASKEKDNEDEQADAAADSDELEEVVFVLQADGTVKRLVVTTDIQDINYIEIKSGLKEGDEVVTGPYNAVSKTLRNGAKVKVVPRDQLFEK